MSLILDALKRAERERQPGQGVALSDLPAPRATRGPRVHPKLIAGVVLLLLVAMGAWKLAHKPRSAQIATAPRTAPAPAPTQAPAAPPVQAPIIASPAPAAGQTQATAPVVVTLPGQKPIIASPAPQPTVIPGTEGVATLDELAQGEPEPALVPAPAMEPKLQPKPAQAKPAQSKPKAAAIQATPAPQASAAPQPQQAEGAAPADESAPAEQGSAPEKAPAAQAAPPAQGSTQREIPAALTQPVPPRSLREMPPEYRADFPALTIQVHVYEQIVSQRFVIVNGRRYRQGEIMAEGPQIVEIVKDGLILDYRGERLLYPISR